MASRFPALLSVLLLLPGGSFAASLHSEKDTLVRREQHHQKLQLTANGALVQEKPEAMVKDEHNHKQKKPQMALGVKTKFNLTFMTEEARYDFPVGDLGTRNCSAPDNEHFIDSPAQCSFAAQASGATVQQTHLFERHKWPKGCFKEACSATDPTICYFYNLLEPTPGVNGSEDITGTPICKRDRFKMAPIGTSDQCSTIHGGAYQNLMDEELCRVAGPLFGLEDSPLFRVGLTDARISLVHPLGCFMDTDDNQTKYNNAASDLIPQIPATGVRGIQICNVSAATSWGGSAGAGAGAGGAGDGDGDGDAAQ